MFGFVNIISSLLVVKSLGCVIITRFDIVLASVSIQLLSDFLRLTVRITLVATAVPEPAFEPPHFAYVWLIFSRFL